MKLEMYKYCAVWGYGEKQTINYFIEMGETLSHDWYYQLKQKFESQQATNNWYSDMALRAMESTHKQSVLQLDTIIKVTMAEIQQLQTTPVYINEGSKEFPKLVLNENHDSSALASMMKTLSELIKTRDDMLSATPVVQAIMNKAAMDKEKSMVKA